MTVINDISHEIKKLEESLKHQKMHLDGFFENYTDSSLDESKKVVFRKKEDFDQDFKQLIGHLYRIRDVIFSGESRDQRNEVEAENLMERLVEHIQVFKKGFLDQNETELEQILFKLEFELNEGVETLDYIQDIISK